MHHKDFVKYAFCHCNMRDNCRQVSYDQSFRYDRLKRCECRNYLRNLQLFDEGFDDFKRTLSEKSGVKFETKEY